MKQQSLFRKLQNNLVVEFLHKEFNQDKIVEFGGTKDVNYKEFSKSSKYIITNIEGEVDQIEDLKNLSFESNSIDAAICVSVLQHVFEFDQAVDEIIRVLKPGGECLITNGFLFPVCMEYDFYRFTPKFWEKRLENENVDFDIKLIGNKYASISNLLMRPYGKYFGLRVLLNKILSTPFTFLYKIIFKNEDNSPLGVAVIIKKL
jgi:SAM-dependent methyltransferase